MSDIPTGTVTFLFTDIQGSTRLAQEHPEKLTAVLEIHHKILSSVIENNEGFVFEIVGDAFCSVFMNPADAVNAAKDIQKKLSEMKGPVELKVRVGINTGEAFWNGTRYIGYLTLARTQRIMSAAHGGQILISDISKTEASARVDNEISFRDLGERRLKDLIKPVRLFQINAPEIPSDFPPIKSLDARQNNLPLQLTSFIGREKEISDLKALLKDIRLLTLTGFGGTGKTRLSLQIGADIIDDFADGVFLIELAPLSESSYIIHELASTFSLRESGNKNLQNELLDFLRGKEMLIIFDNCEHLIEGCANISLAILRSCGKIKLISNSREPLHVEGETIYQVPSLALPQSADAQDYHMLMNYEAISLFTDRAKSVKTDFTINQSNIRLIFELCCRLDGNPLAIELAAAKIRTISIETILEKINDRFRILSGGKRTAMPRQQELTAMIDWSYDLLSEKEKILFQYLSVFAGGWTLDAAFAICSDKNIDDIDVLNFMTNLADKSLIRVIEGKGAERFSMLETIFLYSKEKFTNEISRPVIQRKHAEYFRDFVSAAERNLISGSQKEWIQFVETETDNIRESIKWFLDNEPSSAVKTIVSMCFYWSIKGSFSEGLEMLNTILEKIKSEPDYFQGRALLWKGFLLLYKGNYNEAKESLLKSVEMFKKIEDENEVANAYNYVGVIELYEGNYDSAKRIQEECLQIRNKTKDKRGTAACLNSLGMISFHQRDFTSAENYLQQSLALYKEINDLRGIAANLGNLGKISAALENYTASNEYYKSSLNIAFEIGDKYVTAHCFEGIANNLVHNCEFEKGCLLLAAADSIFKNLSIKRSDMELNQFQTNLQTVKQALGNSFDERWNFGSSLTLEKCMEMTD